MFKQARIRLTAWYLLIITIISFSFSFLIYGLLDREINRFANSQRNRIERDLIILNPDSSPKSIGTVRLVDQDLIDDSRHRLLLNLLIINGFIITVSGALSYFLAGKTLSPIQKMTEDQKRFISDASHELRTPITAMKSLFEVTLRDKNLDLKEAKNVIDTGIDQANRLQKLSDSLLEISRLENNSQKINFETLDFSKIITDSVKQIEPKAKTKKIKLISQVEPAKISGDNNRLVELFTIFLDNAIKYSPDNTVIKILSKVKKNQIITKIVDQGIGISDKDLPYIFDRFYQSDIARTKTKESGYGLGLAIAQKIIQLHRGQISVKSQIDHGTTFILRFPLFS
ncbi:MAG: HAMP domain-containing histidine kinase [Candidatus Shapirobacteria bacterium]|nr:HAMP domain-containing histidine kinase [Candidatus Shapirobacteria bacterium]